MTAEIAILNKGAIALAADSVVTISSGPGSKAKTYKSVNKLFSLSRLHPVGAMIYGSADIMGVPWETLIKDYRRKLGSKSFATIDDYAADLIKHLESLKHVFTPAAQQAFFAISIAQYFMQHVKQPITDIVKQQTRDGAKVKQSEIDELTERRIKERRESLFANVRLLPYLTKPFERSIAREFADQVKGAIEAVFAGHNLSAVSRRHLRDIGVRIICGNVFPDSLTGVVIAGFGEDQVFPAVRTFSPHIIVKNRLMFRDEPDETCSITHTMDAALVPFAQKDVVDAFLKGIDRHYVRIINTAMKEMSSKYPDIVMQHLVVDDDEKKTAITEKIKSETEGLHKAISQRIREHVDAKHVKPLLSVIGVLPKDELAAMAEALVSLTSLKRKMSLEVETVGGPVDVAVISKGDGLVWISRKHYFRPELNLQYQRNHARETRHDGQD